MEKKKKAFLIFGIILSSVIIYSIVQFTNRRTILPQFMGYSGYILNSFNGSASNLIEGQLISGALFEDEVNLPASIDANVVGHWWEGYNSRLYISLKPNQNVNSFSTIGVQINGSFSGNIPNNGLFNSRIVKISFNDSITQYIEIDLNDNNEFNFEYFAPENKQIREIKFVLFSLSGKPFQLNLTSCNFYQIL